MRNLIWIVLIGAGAWLLLKKPAGVAAAEASLAQIEAALPAATGEEKARLLARKTELEAQLAAEQARLAEAARAAEAARLEAEELARLKAEVATVEAAVAAITERADFSATFSQLDELLAAGADKDSAPYQKAVDDAYAKAASECTSGKTVAYSRDTGYTTMTNEEMQARTSYPIWM